MYVRTYSGMWLCSLDREQHERTCNYWYTVTLGGGTPHTAFRTKAALLRWLDDHGLKLTAELPAEIGEHSVQRLAGEYRDAMHYPDRAAFDGISDCLLVRKMSNGDYTLGKITTDSDGLRTVHYLNPNVANRAKFDHRLSREIEDRGAEWEAA